MISGRKKILILNDPASFEESDLYMFRIPEARARLRQYREILRAARWPEPSYVDDILNGRPSSSPDRSILGLIISMGLLDRRIGRQGWPGRLAGRQPLISIAAGERTFESVALGGAARLRASAPLRAGRRMEAGKAALGRSAAPPAAASALWGEGRIFLYKTSSFLNERTQTSYLAGVQRVRSFSSFSAFASYLSETLEVEGEAAALQFLSPNEESLSRDLGPLISPYIQDFLERDAGLRWLWPIWKKAQLKKKAMFQEKKKTVF